jgi:hypothetical protein
MLVSPPEIVRWSAVPVRRLPLSGVERAAKKEVKQESWRGSPADLADLVEGIATLVLRTDAESDRGQERGWVRLSLGGGDDLHFDGATEFVGFARKGDPRICLAKNVSAELRGRSGQVAVRFWLARSAVPFFSAVSVTVTGRDGVVVAGVASEIKGLLRPRGRRLRSSWLAGGLWLAGFALIQLGWIDSAAFRWMSYAGAVCAVVAIYFWFVEPHLMPRFEVADPTAPQAGVARLRGFLVGTGRWLLAAAAGAVIYALADKLING